MLGALVGGGLALLGGLLADMRKAAAERRAQTQRERALLTGMYAVRNHIAQRLQEWDTDGLTSNLEHLRSAQRYVEKLIEKTPAEGEALMIAVIEIGLKLDTLLATIDRRAIDPGLRAPEKFAQAITTQVQELSASLEQFDVIAHGSLSFINAEELDEVLDRTANAAQ